MPTRANTGTRLPIGDLLIRRRLDGLIHDKIFPQLMVEKATMKYYKTNNAHLRLEDDTYTAKGGSNELSYDYTTANIDIKRYSFKSPIDGDIVRDADPVIMQNIAQDTALLCQEALLVAKEKRCADYLFNTSTFSGHTSALSGTNRFDDPSSDVFGLINTAVDAIRLAGGKLPNTVVMNYEVAQALSKHPAVLDRLSSYDTKVLTPALLGQLLSTNGVKITEDRILTGWSAYNSAVEGQTDSFTNIWGKYFLLCYVDPSPVTLRNDTLGKTFVDERDGALWLAETYQDSDKDKDLQWCRVRTSYQFAVTNVNLGYLYSTVVS